MLLDHIIKQEKLNKKVFSIGKLFLSLKRTSQVKKRSSTRTKNAKNLSQKNSLNLDQLSKKMEPLLLPMPQSLMMVLAVLLSWPKM